MKDGWEVKKLGELCGIINGGTPKTKVSEYWSGDINWITPADLGKLTEVTVSNTPRKITSLGLEKSSAKLFPANSVILSTRAPIGHLAINLVPMSTNQGCRGIVPDKNIDTWYLYYFLKMNVDYLNSLGTGATFKELSTDKLSGVEIPVPPLTEQKRIVTILDKAFAAIDKAKANAEQNIINAREVFESYLQEIMNPSTYLNRSDSQGWVESTIGDACYLMTGGTPSKSKQEYFENGNINWLVSGDIHKKVIYDCEGRISELGLKNSNARYLPFNSVLIALNGQGKTRGTVAMLRTKATCNQSLVSIYPKDVNSVLPEFIYANLDGRYDEIRKITSDSGNDRRGLNMPIIRQIKFSYPKSIKEQKTIIKQTSELFAETKKLESIYQKKLDKLEELKKSILHKAFAGEL